MNINATVPIISQLIASDCSFEALEPTLFARIFQNAEIHSESMPEFIIPSALLACRLSVNLARTLNILKVVYTAKHNTKIVSNNVYPVFRSAVGMHGG
jgi:hypothetical protein